ncbi:PAS domain-containing protein [Natronospirillum operosum]|uniref:PAS domain-containing protein n=1 Tax=Natronospirillum operosum TaxID=2759953 RepID=A0A4Z0WEM1_9GAMM|nr:PAS domain-containing protein [Natronospirillum operosum]TGG92766.1 PAS domain-containing protein [Natronospirillum operosum]
MTDSTATDSSDTALRALLDALPLGVLQVSDNGRITLANAYARRLLHTAEHSSELNVHDLMPAGLLDLAPGEGIHCVVGGMACQALLTRLESDLAPARVITLIPQSRY